MIRGDYPIWVHLRSNRLIWRGTLKVQYFKDRKRKDLADWISSMFLVYLIGCLLVLADWPKLYRPCLTEILTVLTCRSVVVRFGRCSRYVI
jgi:hypothetical protein